VIIDNFKEFVSYFVMKKEDVILFFGAKKIKLV